MMKQIQDMRQSLVEAEQIEALQQQVGVVVGGVVMCWHCQE